MMLTNHPVLLLPVADMKEPQHKGFCACGRRCGSGGTAARLLIERLLFQSLAACRSLLGQDTKLRVALNTRVDV